MTPKGHGLVTAYDDVLSDLRQLRRSKALSVIDFKSSPHLVWHTGRGNIDVTAQFMAGLKNIDDIQVSAALASLGFESYSSNIEERMNEFAARYNEESTRTVRRWAEEGFKKIANFAIEWSEEEGNDRALVEILLYQAEATSLSTMITFSGSPRMIMLAPTVEANGKASDILPARDEQRSTHERIFFKSTVVTELFMDRPTAARLQIEWLGNADACYLVQVHPSLRDYVTASIVTKKGCEISVAVPESFSFPDDVSLPALRRQQSDNDIID